MDSLVAVERKSLGVWTCEGAYSSDVGGTDVSIDAMVFGMVVVV